MAKQRNRPQTDAAVPAPFEEARDELFQQIMTCGVIGAEPTDQHEWFGNTMQYLGDRYPELSSGQLTELRTLGQRFVQPPKAAVQDESRVLSGAA
jgi:hypothetical protein